MKNHVALVIAVAVLTAGSASGQPSWSTPGGYSGSMTIIANLTVDGVLSADTGDLVAAFVGTEVRGVVSPGAGGILFLTVVGDTDTERIHLKAYDESENQERTLCTTFAFRENALIGTLGDPVNLSTADGASLGTCPLGWEAASTFSSSMTVNAAPHFPSGRSADPDDRLAAFVGAEIRGVGVPFMAGGSQVFQVAVGADASGETVTFRAYDSTTGLEYQMGSMLLVTTGATLGTPGSPCMLSMGDASVTCQQGTSPVAGNTVVLSGLSGTGNDTGWRVIAPPVAGATRADLADDLDLAVSSGSVLYAHDGSGYVALDDDADELTNGRGYLVYVFDDATDPVDTGGLRIDLPGSGPTADVTVSGLGVADRWHLLGNPYGTGFDLSSLNLVSKGFQAAVQIWDSRTETWTTVTQDAGNDDVLAVWQGFFAERTSIGQGGSSVKFTASGRVAGSPLIGGKREGSRPSRLRIALDALDAQGNSESNDEAALYFTAEASDGWDGFDASKLAPPPATDRVQLALVADRSGATVELAQQSHPLEWDGEAVFELRVSSRNPQERYRFSWPSLVGIPREWSMVLLDRKTSQRVDLRLTPEHVVEGPVTDGRIAIVVATASSVRNDDNPVETGWTLDAPYPNPARDKAVIGFSAARSARVTLDVFDLLGRRVARLQEAEVVPGSHQVTIDTSRFRAGLYRLVLVSADVRLSRSLFVIR